MKTRVCALLIIYLSVSAPVLYAQDSLRSQQLFTLPQAFELAIKNSVQLSISVTETSLAHQAIELNKLGQLPGISTSLNYGYVSNADIWTPSFSEHQKGAIPHQFTQFTTQAGEEIFKGGEIRNNIKKATLGEQIAMLAQAKNIEDIKLLVAGQYLDIYRLINLRQVYVNNVALAQKRLKNILVMQKQGMVTQNDVLRTELTLSDLELAIRKTDNSIAINNTQMNMIIGLPAQHVLLPDTSLLDTKPVVDRVESFIAAGNSENHELKIAETRVLVAETNLKLAGTDRYPTITVFAANNFQRPFVNSIPAIDIYYNIWQAGIGVSYNISSIYQSPRKIKAGKIQLQEAQKYRQLQQQNMEVGVRTYYIKYKEAEDELETSRKDLHAAEENYRIVEKKYFNQLSLLTDLIDATSTKIDAETKVTNAQINRIYAFYLLQKASSGSIEI